MRCYAIVLLTLFSIKTVKSLDCFSCDYSNYLNCNSKVSCRENGRERVTCYKFVVKDSNGNERYKKDCANYQEDPNEQCTFLMERARIEQQSVVGCFTCDYDNCNSATKVGHSILFAAILGGFYCLFSL